MNALTCGDDDAGVGGGADGQVLSRDGAGPEPTAARGGPSQVRAEHEGTGHRHTATVRHHIRSVHARVLR